MLNLKRPTKPKPSNARPYPGTEIPRGRKSPEPAARAGMGAIPHEKGVAFRVWAPHAEAVAVVGTFNNWNATAHALARENGEGYWYVDVPGAKVGDEYRFALKTPWGEL